jgi:hypothetical protein
MKKPVGARLSPDGSHDLVRSGSLADHRIAPVIGRSLLAGNTIASTCSVDDQKALANL